MRLILALLRFTQAQVWSVSVSVSVPTCIFCFCFCFYFYTHFGTLSILSSLNMAIHYCHVRYKCRMAVSLPSVWPAPAIIVRNRRIEIGKLHSTSSLLGLDVSIILRLIILVDSFNPLELKEASSTSSFDSSSSLFVFITYEHTFGVSTRQMLDRSMNSLQRRTFVSHLLCISNKDTAKQMPLKDTVGDYWKASADGFLINMT